MAEAAALPDSHRNFLAASLLKLCISELFVHRFMQTDPNWCVLMSYLMALGATV
jgi:hypothetical protein